VQGVLAAELMHEALAGAGGIVVIEGMPGQSTTRARSKGFNDRLGQLGSRIRILANQTAQWDPVRARAVTENFITAHGGRIDGLFSHDDNTAAAAAETLRGRGSKARVIGVGGSINGITAVRNGLLYGTIEQSPSRDAQQALALALELAAGKPPRNARNIIPMPKITARNVAQFKGEW
jgi:ribose transport system substrate-binding protein